MTASSPLRWTRVFMIVSMISSFPGQDDARVKTFKNLLPRPGGLMAEPLKEPSIVSERTHDREGGFAGQRSAGNTEFNEF